MFEVKNTKPIQSIDQSTEQSVNNTKENTGESMFDKLLSNTTDNTSKIQEDQNQHIQILTIKQQSSESITDLNTTTQLDKLKYLKNIKDQINQSGDLDSLKDVSKKLNLDLKKVAKNTQNISNEKTIQSDFQSIIKSSPEDKMILQSKLGSKIIISKDEDHTIKQNLQSQVDINTLTSLKDKIFDSKAKTQSFMSNIAKQMVENYKPPMTALKISLHPKELGSIDVVIRGNKNSLNISFQSNPVTMDILTQNQSDLRASLTKEFAQNQAFNFNFSQQNQSQDQNNKFTNVLFEDENIEEEEIIKTVIDVDNNIYV
jgi:hypothetical protein